MRPLFSIFMLLAAAICGRAAAPAALEHAVESWLGERDHWAFTQHAIEYQDGKTHERIERYDPSLPSNHRWQLLSIDGQPPTYLQRLAWGKKKFGKPHHRFDSPIGDYFDFERATIASENPTSVRYVVPLRNDKNWLFPTDKVDVTVTVNKETHALEHLTARVREPFKVLLGIAHITGGALDLGFEDSADAAPAAAQPSGAARVSVSRLGERVDFTWTDFKRVTPVPADNATVDGR